MNEKVITVNGYPYHVFHQINNSLPIKWVLLHGFMGSHHDFDTIVNQLPGEVMTFDLLGFGSQAETVYRPSRFKMVEQIDDIVNILKIYNWSSVNLLGYSMGGRIALGLAIRHRELVAHLYLESTTAGLQTSLEREKRRLMDEKRAKQIISDFEEFVLSWEKLPLFSTQKKLTEQQQLAIRLQRLAQKPQNVANSLKYNGTGAQDNYWSQLPYMEIQTTLLVGELDMKFTHIADNMLALLPHAEKYIIKNAGHNIHIEQPDRVIEVIKHVSH